MPTSMPLNLADPKTIKTILTQNGFSFSKALGQNFIINPDVCPQMAEAAIPGPGYGALEIGPGIGVLTAELCRRAEKVVAVELDDRLPPILEQTLSGFDSKKIISGDVMELDLNKLIAEEFEGLKVVICANLPYYITSPVIMKLLKEKLPVESIVVMVQKEAADRLCAAVGTRDAGAVTVAVNYYSQAEKLFFVSKESFLPSPKVDSEVIRLVPRSFAGEENTLFNKSQFSLPCVRGVAGKYSPVESFSVAIQSFESADESNLKTLEAGGGVVSQGENSCYLPPADEEAFFKMVTSAFTKRRKTVMNSLLIPPVTKEALAAELDSLGILRTSRIEQLTLPQLVDIYKRLFA